MMMWITLCILLVVLVTGCRCLPSRPPHRSSDPRFARIRAHPTNNWYLDKHNRVRIFHGVNAVEKGFPWYPPYMLNKTRLDDLQDWGFNIVRHGMMWSGVEPEQGRINKTYLDISKTIMKEYSKRGIYSLLDMHQDVISSKFPGFYDGVPRWLIDTFPKPTNPYPWPLEKIQFWEEGYLTQAVAETFQHFYDNYNGAINKWGNFWKTVAENFRDSPYVIGYEFMNEPWVGDHFSDKALLLPGYASKVNLVDNYDKINAQIRSVDNHTMVFYEPIIYGYLFHDDILGSGFTRVPGGEQYRDRSAYSWHYYCWGLEFIGNNATDEERRAEKEFCDKFMFPEAFRTQQANTKQTGGAAMLTEFGLCNTEETTVNVECKTMLDTADQYLHSWTYWDYTGYTWYPGPDGHRKWGRILPFVRAYAQAIAGEPISMKFTEETLEFTLKFLVDTKIKAPTEIFVPKVKYPKGFSVAVPNNIRWEINDRGDIVYLYNQGGLPREAIVRITPRK